MNKIKLTLREAPKVVLESEVITPDRFLDQSNEEIRASVVYHGKRQKRLDDFFEVDGERSDHIDIHGDLTRVRHIGRGMTRGSVTIHGDVGMRRENRTTSETITQTVSLLMMPHRETWLGMTAGILTG